MNVDVLSPSYYGEDRISILVDPKTLLLAGRPISLSFDYSQAEPGGVVLPVVVQVQPALGDGFGYVRRVFRRSPPRVFSFTPIEAGEYLVLIQEAAHNRWQGRLVLRVAGDRVNASSLGVPPVRV